MVKVYSTHVYFCPPSLDPTRRVTRTQESGTLFSNYTRDITISRNCRHDYSTYLLQCSAQLVQVIRTINSIQSVNALLRYRAHPFTECVNLLLFYREFYRDGKLFNIWSRSRKVAGKRLAKICSVYLYPRPLQVTPVSDYLSEIYHQFVVYFVFIFERRFSKTVQQRWHVSFPLFPFGVYLFVLCKM